MRTVVYALIVTALALGVARAQAASKLEGWMQLAAAVRATQPNSIQALNGRQFELRANAASTGESLKLKPEEAFRIERVNATTFRVTVTDAAKLFEVDGDLLLPKSIGWRLTTEGEEDIFSSLEGTPYCSYLVRFRQKGGSELDLSKYGDDRVSWEFSNLALVDESTREASGIRIMRAAPGTSDLKVRLRIARTNQADIGSDWVTVPHCATPLPEKRIVREESAESCIQVAVRSYDYCQGQCGAFSFTAKAHAHNVCSRSVKCTDMTWTLNDGDRPIGSYTMWVDLSAGQETNYDVPLSASYQPAKFSVKPGAGVCRFN